MVYFMDRAGPFRIEYSRFILVDTRMRRTLYLVVFAVLVAALALGGLYYRHRVVKAQAAPAAANCDSPAPPPPPREQPKLPDFVEAGCGSDAAKKPAVPKK
jgi:hypothetical protein